MAKLKKTTLVTYIPADPGSPGYPGRPYSPAYTSRDCYTTERRCGSYWLPVYEVGAYGTYVVSYFAAHVCTEGSTVCTTVQHPAVSELPAIPATSPTPAQTIINLQEGWNASAQAFTGIAVDEAYLFQVSNGARGVLVGLATEPWTPVVSMLPHGIMFSDGHAQVYENGTFQEPLDDFFRGEEFIIGRGENYILYYNMTSGSYVIRAGIPAPPSVPLYLFALLYQGGDTVIT